MYRRCYLYENKICTCEEEHCRDREDGCENLIDTTAENGYLVDYKSKWSAVLEQSSIRKYGWRVFRKSGEFSGILDENKAVLWNVIESTLEKYE